MPERDKRKSCFFSVIMPVYNVESYLAEAIESVLNQSFTDFELILVNDGSTDSSLNIANRYKKRDSRISVISQENKGLSEARNSGLLEAKGDYIYFIDSDDKIQETCLEFCFHKFQKFDADAVFFSAKPFTDGLSEDLVATFSKYYNRINFQNYDSGKEAIESMSENGAFIASACLYAFNKSIVNQSNLKFIPNQIFEDELFTRTLLLNSKKTIVSNEKFYLRRVRKGSIQTTKANISKIISLIQISETLFDLSKEHNMICFRVDAKRFAHQAFRKAKEYKPMLKALSLLRKSSFKKYVPDYYFRIGYLFLPTRLLSIIKK